MSDRYTVAVEGPDGWSVYEASDHQIGLLRAGVPARVVLAACEPIGKYGQRPNTLADLTIDRTGRLSSQIR